MPRSTIYLCFFLSGFSGLVNEVVWSRLFVYTLGSSHQSIAVVVSVFMGGLALGSFFGGRIADRSWSALRLYGWLVAAAGLLSGAVIPLLWLFDPVIGWVYRFRDGETEGALLILAKVAVCAATIFLPATLMGATLPALARHVTRTAREAGARLGALYAANTFGAVAGAAAAGFLLIRALGLAWSAALGAAIDVAVGAGVLLATGGLRSPASMRSPPTPRTWGEPAPLKKAAPESPLASGELPRLGVEFEAAHRTFRIVLVAFGLSGFANMCLQIGWTRALIISIGNSTYAFSIIVATFIFGLALGGWIAGLFADRLRRPAAAFGWVLIAIAFTAGATIPWLGLAPARFAWELGQLARESGFGFDRFLYASAWRVAVVILPATILMGMTFPLAGRVQALAVPGIGRAVGGAYAANTVGAVLGTALAGFVLLPLFGKVWALLYLAVGIGTLGGAAVLIAAPGELRLRRIALLGAAAAAMLLAAWWTRPAGVLDPAPGARRLWHPVIYAVGAYRNYHQAALCSSVGDYVDALLRSYASEYYRDGNTASVAVLSYRGDERGGISLNIAGKTDASAGTASRDRSTQLLLGHLPALVHPQPRKALTLGLGGGMTVGAMTLHPDIERIDLLEISPEVVEAARRFFAEANHGALDDPRVRTIIGDGRNHLAHTALKYDLISSEPSNFWIAGLGSLFTEEFYRILLERLEPGGIVCQWIYTYRIRPEDYRVALRTFHRVFPHATVWSDNRGGDTLLLGSREPMRFHRDRIAGAIDRPEVRAELATLGIAAPEDLFRYFKADGGALAGWIGDGPINRDLHPVLEFSSPRGLFDTTSSIDISMDRALPDSMPPALFSGFSGAQLEAAAARYRSGRAMLRFIDRVYSGDLPGAAGEYEALARLGDPWAIDWAAHEISRAAAAMGEKGKPILDRVRRARDTPELWMADGYRQLPGVDWEAQLAAYESFVRAVSPESWESYFALARLMGNGGKTREALAELETARRLGAPAYRAASLRGVLLGMQGDLEASEAALRDAVRLAPPGAPEKGEALYNLGVCLRRRGDAAAALEAVRQALQHVQERGGDSHEARAEIGRALSLAGKTAEAIQWLESAARLAPGRYEREIDELRAAPER